MGPLGEQRFVVGCGSSLSVTDHVASRCLLTLWLPALLMAYFLAQWEIQNTSRLAADGDRASTWPVGIPAPSRPASRFEVLRWDYFTEQYAFSCADGSPRCPLRGADQADVADVLGTALEELNRRYQPALRLQKQQLVNGYRRFDPARGMEYTLDLRLEALTPQGGRWPLTRRVQLLRPLSRVEILPVPYVTEASRLTVLLPLAAAERDLASGFLEAFATAALEPGDAASLTLLLLYEPRQAQRAAHADVFAPVKAHVAELERRFPGARVPWLSVQTAAPSPLRLMDLLSKKHPLDTLFLLAGPDTVLTPDFLNRCRMHAISGWQAFFPCTSRPFTPPWPHLRGLGRRNWAATRATLIARPPARRASTTPTTWRPGDGWWRPRSRRRSCWRAWTCTSCFCASPACTCCGRWSRPCCSATGPSRAARASVRTCTTAVARACSRVSAPAPSLPCSSLSRNRAIAPSPLPYPGSLLFPDNLEPRTSLAGQGWL